jgi:hypothetical protein
VAIAECSREQDVVDALTTGRWPERCDADLRAHVQSCEICADVAAIFMPLREAWDATRDSVQVPSSGAMWWRAQLRARQEAAQVAATPITLAQACGAVAALVVGIAVLVVMFPWLTQSLGNAAHVAGTVFASWTTTGGLSSPWMIPVLAVGAGLLLTPIAVYLAIGRD